MSSNKLDFDMKILPTTSEQDIRVESGFNKNNTYKVNKASSRTEEEPNEDATKKTVTNTRFFNIGKPEIDLSGLTNIFNSYATKKTYATGFFNLALVATNFAQMKQLITLAKWVPLNIVLLTFVCVSLLFQFVVAILLIFLAKSDEFIDENKRNQLIRSNTGTTILVLIISVINIFINVFISI